jgi:hypothetical protein
MERINSSTIPRLRMLMMFGETSGLIYGCSQMIV